jgi:excisionase family DNA binding protein
MVATPTKRRIGEYLTVGEAAEFLGVSSWTLRNWDKAGKLKPIRHPKNGYRIYRQEDLQSLLDATSEMAQGRDQSNIDWSKVGRREHFVQFYENDRFLASSVAEYAALAIAQNGAAVVIATPAHQIEIRNCLDRSGVDTARALEDGRLIMLDAQATLDRFMVGGAPDPLLFQEVVGSVIRPLADANRRIHAFGEMVTLLWEEGNRDAAIRLEELWNNLSKQYAFALYCAYPMTAFDKMDDGQPLAKVCTCHTRVIPAESFLNLTTETARNQAVVALQQKARALESERSRRQEAESNLSRSGSQSDLLSAEQSKARRILIVDDNRDAAVTLGMLLRFMGNEVEVAHDGQSAIGVAERFCPDVILMDVGMPILNGYDATRRIRQQPWGKEMTIVALTGWGRPDDMQQALDSGCNTHMLKPVDPKHLEQLLAELPASAV